MANSPSAKKRARQSLVRRARNASHKSLIRTMIKKVITAIHNKNPETAQTAYAAAVPIIDRMANKKIIHKNKAARHKSRLNGKIKALTQTSS